MAQSAFSTSSLGDTPDDTSALRDLIAGLGYEIVDIAGFLESVQQSADVQLDTMKEAQLGLTSINQSSAEVVASVDKINQSSQRALSVIDNSVDAVRASTERSQSVSKWVTKFEERITAMTKTLRSVENANREIAEISAKVNILAINASIESARAGDAGRGFAVLATAINELSKNTARAAGEIKTEIGVMSKAFNTLKSETAEVTADAQEVIASAGETNTALGEIAKTIRQSAEDTQTIANQAERVETASKSFEPAFHKLSTISKETAMGVINASERASALIERSEAIVQSSTGLSGKSIDTPFIAYVQNAADRIGDRWEAAIAAGQISMEALFDKRYHPIAGSEPEQVMARFTAFTDITLPNIQEDALGFDPKVVFCAAVDTSGYLPTHNRKFSAPQSDDPVWNASNCRNRRIFDDRVGLKSGRNTKPFLLQVYRRDMGGGAFAMMKDLSAPIFVNGRHWGGLRMAYTFD
jgi:methyl-accepting chemotaxis protein